jgi:hypothetical protein
MDGYHRIDCAAGSRTVAWRERVRSLLTTAEVAAYCDVEEELVLHWIDARVLPARRIDADFYNVAFVDLWAFLERWSLLGSASALAGRAVLADGAGPC